MKKSKDDELVVTSIKLKRGTLKKCKKFKINVSAEARTFLEREIDYREFFKKRGASYENE